MKTQLDFDYLRQQIVGVDSSFRSPFGERLLVYCDYTASGRTLRFVEDYLLGIQRSYANSHTEDDITGRSMTRLLHEAEQAIKDCVNAGPEGRIVCCGSGATAAVDKFQQIVGVALSPATRRLLFDLYTQHSGETSREEFESYLRENLPVVFVGPYEHHSNEVTWREGLATTVAVRLTADGAIDLEHLEQLLQDPRYADRMRIGSFSAGSNVTGMISPVRDISRLLHRYGAIACFDYAASAPYVPIDMNPEQGSDGGDASIDAIFISPHKFLGGPGSCGVLVFNQRLYHPELPPTVGGGGTVDYVGYDRHDFVEDVEEREKAGTPGVLQVLKAALAFEVKRAAGEERIETREQELLDRAFARWNANERIEILGNPDPARRIGIVSFNLKTAHGDYLHPKFVTTLANDLFGIQSRAGCSCAGPYGHRLLQIDKPTSERYRSWILKGYSGIKPGWCRVGFHYTMDDAEADYVIDCIEFIAKHGELFLTLYRFDVQSGSWAHVDEPRPEKNFSFQAALEATHIGSTALTEDERRDRYAEFMDFAHSLAESLASAEASRPTRLEGEVGELQFFTLPEACPIHFPSGADSDQAERQP